MDAADSVRRADNLDTRPRYDQVLHSGNNAAAAANTAVALTFSVFLTIVISLTISFFISVPISICVSVSVSVAFSIRVADCFLQDQRASDVGKSAGRRRHYHG